MQPLALKLPTLPLRDLQPALDREGVKVTLRLGRCVGAAVEAADVTTGEGPGHKIDVSGVLALELWSPSQGTGTPLDR